MSRIEPDDEVLPVGPGLPRWLPWLAAAVLVVLGIFAVLSRLPTGSPSLIPTPDGPTAQPTGSHHVATSPSAPAPVATGPALTLPDRADPLDVFALGDEAWLLQADRLSTFTTDANYRTRPIPDVSRGTNGPGPHLIVDSAAHRVWVVVLGIEGSTIRAFDSETLVPIGSLSRQDAMTSAAVLAGQLVFTDDSGVFRYRPGELDAAQVYGAGTDGELTADPGRARVLLIRPGVHPELVVIPASGPVHQLSLSTSLATGTLAVTGSGAVWLGGYSEDGPVLARLDPNTFQPVVRRSPIAFEAGSGVHIVASGTDDLLIGTGEAPVKLTCMSGADGSALQSWPLLTDAATITRGGGYAVVGTDVVPLELHGGCTG